MPDVAAHSVPLPSWRRKPADELSGPASRLHANIPPPVDRPQRPTLAWQHAPAIMPSIENLYSHPEHATHGRSSSLTNLARLPGMAREKLTHLQFVRFIEDNDGQDKDENDIYRQNVSTWCQGAGSLRITHVRLSRWWVLPSSC